MFLQVLIQSRGISIALNNQCNQPLTIIGSILMSFYNGRVKTVKTLLGHHLKVTRKCFYTFQINCSWYKVKQIRNAIACVKQCFKEQTNRYPTTRKLHLMGICIKILLSYPYHGWWRSKDKVGRFPIIEKIKRQQQSLFASLSSCSAQL